MSDVRLLLCKLTPEPHFAVRKKRAVIVSLRAIVGAPKSLGSPILPRERFRLRLP
jgi:hypothetical protein